MATYDLSHLTQSDNQRVIGPIQDDEALLLYAIIRVLRLERVLEFGYLGGYSATNFLKAVGPKGVVYSCDINKVNKLADNHIPLQKSAALVTAEDLGNVPLELVFFDCHNRAAQMMCFDSLCKSNIITDKTLLVLHDTGTHPCKVRALDYKIGPGEFVHQPVERSMVNEFVAMGYSPMCFHIEASKTSKDLPFRHGTTILSKFKPLIV